MEITYSFLQHYWWFLISLLAGLLVFMLFVQGGNSFIYSLCKDERERMLLVNCTGRKWELSFTTLVCFGGAFFASFPLFYSTSFSGGYALWMIILFTYVLHAVSYEFQTKAGNIFGRKTYRFMLFLNGLAAPFLLAAALSVFFTGAPFTVNRDAFAMSAPQMIQWQSPWRGLEALANIWNILFALSILFLCRYLALQYIINSVDDESFVLKARKRIPFNAAAFLLCFVAFFVHLMLSPACSYTPADGQIHTVQYKYLQNLADMPLVAALLLLAVALLLYSLVRTLARKDYKRGIWPAGTGSVLATLALMLLAAWNNTAYYPSLTDLQSSLTIENSSSSFFTLKVMAFVSLGIPVVLAYIAYVWRKMNKKRLSSEELAESEEKY
ncbi:MAG TPA: cytochrome d ubiquinol oxidase subunit II [Candidatus Onthomorpha intestinigallinarum]|uniref:Cytochrome d ubiquinol oxidase subunit II n=1 Tax=Candidatus Onthomorpha intestinigallinarum TaxID=2840880 RepID=A0A9D1UIS1_9BACT|nr:cytochrome d ubiquinol oxidase subunit II [Candidatus Onthomorpha intestinigallinarum]